MAYSFNWVQATGILTITTDLMTLRFQHGVVLSIQNSDGDFITGSDDTEININYNTINEWKWNYPTDSIYFIGLSARAKVADVYYYRTSNMGYTNGTDNPAYSPSSNVATLDYNPAYTYSSVTPSLETGTRLTYTFTVDDSTGEIVIAITFAQTTGSYSGVNYEAYAAFLPIMNLQQQAGCSLISGPKEWKHDDASYPANVNDRGNAFIGQKDDGCLTTAVFVTPSGTVGAWTESLSLNDEKTYITHSQNSYAHASMQSTPDIVYCENNSYQQMQGGPWRITIQDNWLEVARRWRTRYQVLYSDAQPLWNNACSWVRRIHASYTRNSLYGSNTWAGVAGVVDDSSKVLYKAEATGSGQHVVFGDNDWLKTTSLPDAAMRTAWSGVCNFKVLGYYEYTLVDYDMDYELSGGGIPLDYPTQDATLGPPKYGVGTANTGTPQNWMNDTDFRAAISSISVPYGVNWMTSIHSASTFMVNMLAFNYPQFCQGLDRNGDPNNMGFYCDGAYWDILGTSEDWDFKNKGGTVLQNGKSPMQGTQDMAKQQYVTYPMQAEDAHRGIIPYTFYVYVTGTTDSAAYANTANHPFRTTCWGSFAWNEHGKAYGRDDYRQAVLKGCLPEYVMNEDFLNGGTSDLSPVSRAVAKLYCKMELHHDLPTAWSYDRGSYPTILAYYRSNTGNMFRFEDRGNNVLAFIEERDSGDYDRLVFNDSTYDIATENIDVEFSMFSKGSYTSLPTTADDLTSIYTSNEVSQVTSNDEVYATQEGLSEYVIHQYKQIETTVDDIQANITCNLQSTIAPSQSNVVLEVYDTNSDTWVEVDREVSAAADTDFDMSFNLTSGSTPTFENSKDGLGVITSRIWQHAE